MIHSKHQFLFFFFNDTATTEIYTLSLHDALPIFGKCRPALLARSACRLLRPTTRDRKSTRLNSSHGSISYAVFCLKKKKKHYERLDCTKKVLDKMTEFRLIEAV